MSRKRINFGISGEQIAIDFLKQNGYCILKTNYKLKVAEIDIIAKDKDTVCFIEVKARSSADYGLPQEAVSAAKQRKISKAALFYLKENKSLDKDARFDVVSIVWASDAPKIELIKNAFDLCVDFSY